MKKLLAILLCLIMIMPTAAAWAGGTMTDGTYTATFSGMDGPITLDVTVENDAITAITVTEDNETAGVGAKALEILPSIVIENQSLAVDSISGATITSAAFKAAVADAIGQAGGDAGL